VYTDQCHEKVLHGPSRNGRGGAVRRLFRHGPHRSTVRYVVTDMTDKFSCATGPVSMRTDDVFALSEALSQDAQRFHADATRLMAQLTTGEGAYGADPRNLPAVHAVRRHTDVQDMARNVLDGVGAGLASMSRSTRAVIATFGDQDGLNAAGIDAVTTALGLPAAAEERNDG
jgi:hypothetical protein